MNFRLRRSSECSTVGLGLTMLLVGAAVGAVTALLFAPKNGQQMRRSLRRKYEDVTDSIGELREQAGEVLERGAALAQEAKEAAKERIAPLTRAVGQGS
jgi:gas vesicle protein